MGIPINDGFLMIFPISDKNPINDIFLEPTFITNQGVTVVSAIFCIVFHIPAP